MLRWWRYWRTGKEMCSTWGAGRARSGPAWPWPWASETALASSPDAVVRATWRRTTSTTGPPGVRPTWRIFSAAANSTTRCGTRAVFPWRAPGPRRGFATRRVCSSSPAPAGRGWIRGRWLRWWPATGVKVWPSPPRSTASPGPVTHRVRLGGGGLDAPAGTPGFRGEQPIMNVWVAQGEACLTPTELWSLPSGQHGQRPVPQGGGNGGALPPQALP